MKKYLLATIFVSTILFACNKETDEPDNNTTSDSSEINYRQEMRNFVKNISEYAKNINSAFVIIPQNGVELVSTNGEHSGSPALDYINAIDGIGQEDLFYGYNNDNEQTPAEANQWLSGFLDMAKNNGVKILVTDYCFTHSYVDDSYQKNNQKGYISFAANHRELDTIPLYPSPLFNENTNIVTSLDSAKNFLYLLAPDNYFSNSQDFVNAVKNTNYDLIIMDYFFNGQEYTDNQIAELKQKANGGKRMIISYMSIGEAEEYRYYWQQTWTVGNPGFIYKENPEWQGNYVVKYWDKQWQDIIFGNDSSYLKKIIDKGFDGVYLDIIDAYESFE